MSTVHTYVYVYNIYCTSVYYTACLLIYIHTVAKHDGTDLQLKDMYALNIDNYICITVNYAI